MVVIVVTLFIRQMKPVAFWKKYSITYWFLVSRLLPFFFIEVGIGYYRVHVISRLGQLHNNPYYNSTTSQKLALEGLNSKILTEMMLVKEYDMLAIEFYQ